MDIVICDDLAEETGKLAELAGQAEGGAVLHIFNRPGETLDYIRAGGAADVCFLDILMPEMNGIELAERLRAAGFGREIVFLTASNEYAAESYAVGAFSYLLKPPSAEDFSRVLGRVQGAVGKKDELLPVKSVGSVGLVPFGEISYIEATARKVFIRLADKSGVQTNATFREVAERLLSDGRFVQCHRSYIVNLNHVLSISGHDLVMRGAVTVPLSKNFAGAKQKYLSHLFNKGQP